MKIVFTPQSRDDLREVENFFIFLLTNDKALCIIANVVCADVAHLVERHLAKVEVASSSLVIRSKKEVTFVYQKLLLFLSIAKAMAYHHALACISLPQAYIVNRRLYRFRNDDIQHFVLMICNFLRN